MKRLGGLVLALAVLTPAAVQAQRKPANSMHTRSAEVYLGNARATSAAAERTAQLEKALEALQQGTQSDADNPKVWFLLGQTQALLGDGVAADAAFDKAEALYPDYAAEIAPQRLDLWIRAYNAGVAALQAGDAAGATAKFEAADAVYRGRPEALISLGSLYMRAGDVAKAEQAYRSALELIRGPAARELKPEQAEEWKQDEETVSTELAALLAETDRPAEAAAIYRELLASQPDNAQAKTNLAVTLSRAGQADEAAKLYGELLSRQDLSDVALFNIGVGLYRAEQFDRSAEAFARALERNEHSPETLYNLGQALVAAAADAEAARRLELNRKLHATASKLIALDPNNRNVLMMLAQAERSQAEAEADAAKAEQLKQQVVKTLERAEALAFDVSSVVLEPGDGVVAVTGRLTNQKVPAGQPIVLEFTFVDAQGGVVGSNRVTVPAPAAGQAVPFTVELETDTTVAGWRYTVAR